MLPDESDNAQKVHLGKYLYKPVQGVFSLTRGSGVRNVLGYDQEH